MRFGFGFSGFGFGAPNGLVNPSVAPPQFASWPALIGAEMVVNGDCSSDVGWIEGAGVTVNIVPGKMAMTGASSDTQNTGVAETLLAGADYRCAFTIDAVTLGTVQLFVGSNSGAIRSTAGTFSQDINTGDGGDWILTAFTATMQLDNFSVKSIGLLGQSPDWSFTGTTPPTFTAGGFIDMNGCDTGDVASLTGAAKTAFDASVSSSTDCTVTVTTANYVQGLIEIRMKGGSWVEVTASPDGDHSADITSGAGSGFDIRGKSDLSGPAILQITRIQIILA